MTLNPYITQTDSKGQEYQVRMVEKDLTKPPKWINRVEYWCWIVTIKYLADGRKVKININYQEKINL